MSKTTELAVVRAAMRESRVDITKEWGSYPVFAYEKMIQLAEYCSPAKAARLRACAAHAKSLKGRR